VAPIQTERYSAILNLFRLCRFEIVSAEHWCEIHHPKKIHARSADALQLPEIPAQSCRRVAAETHSRSAINVVESLILELYFHYSTIDLLNFL
jgi:hypothetical protein